MVQNELKIFQSIFKFWTILSMIMYVKRDHHLPGIINKIIQISEPNEINEFCFDNDEADGLNPVLLPLQVFVFDRTVQWTCQQNPTQCHASYHQDDDPLFPHQYFDTPVHFKKLL